MIRAKRVITFAGQNFVRNAWLSAVTLTVLVIMLLAVNLIIGVNFTKNELLKNAQNKINVTIDFKVNVTEKDVNQITDSLKKQPEIRELKIITPDEHLANFKQNFPAIADKALPSLDQNPLGYQLQIKAQEPKDYQKILDQIETADYSSLISNTAFNDYRDFFAKAESFISQVNFFGLIIALIFLLLGIIIVFNTIRVSVYTQREEVGIMKLVGATNWFVRAPFLLETVFYALAATMTTFLLIYALLRFSSLVNLQIVDGVPLDLSGYYQQNFWLLFLSQFTVIALINISATLIALRRFLKV